MANQQPNAELSLDGVMRAFGALVHDIGVLDSRLRNMETGAMPGIYYLLHSVRYFMIRAGLCTEEENDQVIQDIILAEVVCGFFVWLANKPDEKLEEQEPLSNPYEGAVSFGEDQWKKDKKIIVN